MYECVTLCTMVATVICGNTKTCHKVTVPEEVDEVFIKPCHFQNILIDWDVYSIQEQLKGKLHLSEEKKKRNRKTD